MDWYQEFIAEQNELAESRSKGLEGVLSEFYEKPLNPNLAHPLTKSGQHVFMDMDGHKVFTYEGWKENQEAAVAWAGLAEAALDHLKKGFEKDGGSWSEFPVRGTEAAMTAVDSALELGSGIGRFVARSWRDDEEENQAAYDAYLRMTANFNRRYSGKSFVGDLHRGLGTGAGAEADAMVDPQWADAWGMLLDPMWLIPGGQATKVSKLINLGAKGQKLAAAVGKVAQLAQKVPGATAASTMAGKFLGAPASQTAAGVGRVIEGFGKAGTWVGEKAGSSRALGIVAGGAAGVTAFSTLDEADSDWIKWLGSAGAAYGTAKALPFALAKGGSVVSGAGQSIHAAAKAAEMGLGRAANLGRYSDGLARKMKVIDNAPVNFLLRNSNNLANYAVRGAAFGAGMGYLVAGKEGAASGIGVGLVGGPLGAVQGKVITGVDRVSFHKPDGDGGWLRVDAKSILDVPYKDLVTNWMADMPAENRTALAEWAAARGKGADRILHGMAMVEMFAKGLLTKVDDEKVGDINVLYIRDDDHMAARFPEHPEFQGVEGFQHVDSNGKPVAVVNLQHSKDPLYTLTHEIFHPDWKTADPENPLAMARAELEGVFFGVKDIEGNEVVKGMFDEDQFLSLEDQYLSRLHGDDDASIQKHKDDRSMPERRSHIAAELISDAGGMFALASGGDMAAHANKVLRRAKVDDFTQKYFKFSADKFRTMLAGKTRSALERIGITFDAGGDPVRSPLFRDPRKLTEYASGEESGQTFWDFDSPQGKPITNSPEINRIIAEYVKNKNKLHEHLTVQESDPDGGVAVTAKQILSKQDTNSVQRMASSGMFALNPDGTVKFQGGRPVLLSKKERDMIAEAQSAAIYKALESVDVPDDQKPFALVRFGEGDESYYRGRYMSREQLDAVTALPDEVLPASIKARIVQLNSGLAKGFDSAGNLVGDPASNLLISYFKATSGSRYTSRAKMNWQVSSPYGWNISRAGNFNLQTFSIVRFENKLNRWWGKAGKGNKSYQNFFGLFGGSKDQFRADVIKYLDNQARGVQNPAGQKKDAIFDFLNVADIDNKRMMPDRLSTDARNEHVVPVSLRVDRMAEINPSMGDAMPVNWRRLNANFMPATEPKNIEPEAGGRQGQLVPEDTRGTIKRPPRIKELEEKSGRVDEMTADEWAAAVEEHSPIRPVADADLPTPAKLRIMDEALLLRDDDGNPLILKSHQIDAVAKPQHGAVVRDARIDIDSVRRGKEQGMDIHAVAVKGEGGKTMYTGHLLLDPIEKGGTVELHYGRGRIAKTAERMLRTAQGEAKTTFAFVDGKVNNYNTPSRKELMRTNKDGERVWTQVGFNPTRHGYYYNKHDPSMKVLSGDRVLMAGNTVYVRNANQVKAEKVPGLVRMGRGEGAGPEVRYMPAGDRRLGEPSPMGFYSKAERVVNDFQPKGVGRDLLAQMRKAGVKAEELKELGLDRLLNNDQSFTKGEIQDHLLANKITVEETVLGGKRELAQTEEMMQGGGEPVGAESASTKHDSYVEPGAVEGSYRELLLRLPAPDWHYEGRRDAPSREAAASTYTVGHYGEHPNVLAHIRFNERTGPNGERVLFLEEIQSDWHQEGRKKGYRLSGPEAAKAKAVADEAKARLESKHDEIFQEKLIYLEKNGRLHKLAAELEDLKQQVVPGEGYDEAVRRVSELQGRYDDLRLDVFNRKEPTDDALLRRDDANYRRMVEEQEGIHAQIKAIDKEMAERVPDAPFKTSWHELAMKRMIRYAADNGFDSIAWTKGETQANRYDLSKQVDEIQYGWRSSTKHGEVTQVSAVKGNDRIINIFINEDGVAVRPESAEITESLTGKHISDIFGKDIAEKIMRGDSTGPAPYGGKSLSGLDLKVGGEGMKGFYDKMLPRMKTWKKLGLKVEEGVFGQRVQGIVIMDKDFYYGKDSSQPAEFKKAGTYEIRVREAEEEGYWPKVYSTIAGGLNEEGVAKSDLQGYIGKVAAEAAIGKMKDGLAVLEGPDLNNVTVPYLGELPAHIVHLSPEAKGKAMAGMTMFLPAGKNAEVAPGVVKATPNKSFQLDENVRAQFLPVTKKVNLEDYADRKVIALAADRMGIGVVFVGPEGGKRPLSIEAQGGRGFMNIFNGGGWAFSDAGTARKFLTRLKKDADADGNAVVGITIQSPVNHLKNQAGQLAYVEAMQAAVESGAISKRAADSQVRAMSDAILASGSKKMTATTRAKIKRIRNLAGLEKAVKAKSLNFEDMNWVLKQWERKKLHIPDEELRAMDIAPDNIARGITDPELRDLPNYSVVALMEVNVNQVPDVTQFHYAYPVTVHGNAIGYLNRFHNIKDLTTDQRIIQKGTGQVGAQPLQTVMPVMDNILKTTREVEGIPSDPSARYMPAGDVSTRFEGMTRKEFLGDPLITSSRNAKDLKPIALKSLKKRPEEEFLSEYTARYSENGAAVYDGKKLIASYNFGDTLVVVPEYRRRGIGQELVYQWRTRYPGKGTARARTKFAQKIQEDVWNRIRLERDLQKQKRNK